MTEELRGTVRKIIFSSDDGRFCVFLLDDEKSGQIVTVSYRGSAPYAGQCILIRGCWQRHPRFGMQFKGNSLENIKPKEMDEMRRFLASGMIDGIGPAMADRIVDFFGKSTMEVFEQRLEDLIQVPGIGKKTLERIKESYEQIAQQQELIMFLQSMGISERFAGDIQKLYGDQYEEVFIHDPYRMIGEVPGLGFRDVDRIALEKGISPNDSDRIMCGINYMLSIALGQGHACVPSASLYRNTARILNIPEEIAAAGGDESIESGMIPAARYKDEIYLYLPFLYEAETECSIRVRNLLKGEKLGSAKLAIEKFERENRLEMAEEQRLAVEKAMESGLLVITGGPGTGKTTIVRAIIAAAGQHELSVRLMAPTGRAAKRLSLSSGMEADTIHKALEAEMRESGGTWFGKNESEPLNEDLVIVDEASMMDISLFYHLLCALKRGARLILVGDVDQLPPVGPGAPLKALIQWGKVPVVRLVHIFRQQEGSGIIRNAGLIRDGESCVPDEKGEFSIYYVNSEEEAFDDVMELCDRYHYGDDEVKMTMQVLSPMYRGLCGVDHLNHAIQERIHQCSVPEGPSHFLPGDKVMQRRNDYDKGIYNGDTGEVWAVDKNKLFVHFDSKEVIYEGEERNNVQLAYASTVHKCQGSEYDTIILILLPTQDIMLRRNLLYTGVTRAKKKTILITTEDAIYRAVSRGEMTNRYSLFLPLLKEEVEI